MNRFVGSAVAQKASHSYGIWIIVLQPLFTAKSITDRSLQFCRSATTSLALPHAITAKIAAVRRAPRARSASAGRNTRPLGGGGVDYAVENCRVNDRPRPGFNMDGMHCRRICRGSALRARPCRYLPALFRHHPQSR